MPPASRNQRDPTAATPPPRSPRPRLMHQPLSAPKSAADLHAAPPPAARATTTCPEELDPTAVAPPSQRSPCMVLRRPIESAQYAAHDYRRLLDEHGMLCSMSRKGDCWDNAPMES